MFRYMWLLANSKNLIELACIVEITLTLAAVGVTFILSKYNQRLLPSYSKVKMGICAR